MKNKIKNGAKECEVVDFEVQCNTTRLKFMFFRCDDGFDRVVRC